jgi:hypothetical protein
MLELSDIVKLPRKCTDLAAVKRLRRGELTPHIDTGLPSASRGVKFLLNFFPPR